MAKLVDRSEILSGDDVNAIARTRARYGHTNWIVWRDKDGTKRAARVSIAALKMAMLATGTQGHFTMYQASDGGGAMMTWPLSCLLLKNLKFWDRNPGQGPRWIGV